jgi:ComF family protein
MANPPAGWLCSPCRAHTPAFDRLLTIWTYQPPLDKVVQALKFARLDYLGPHLAQALVDELGTALSSFDRVVPVPLHWRRQLTRGYNQAERIARPMASLLGLPCRLDLRRRRATPPQTSLGRDSRRENLRGVFSVPRPARVRGRRILLVDDVATTGATLDAAADVLRTAGATAVVAVVAARTPLEG